MQRTLSLINHHLPYCISRSISTAVRSRSEVDRISAILDRKYAPVPYALSLVDTFLQRDQLEDAMQLFDVAAKRADFIKFASVSWVNEFIARGSDYYDADYWVEKLLEWGLKPDAITCIELFRLCKDFKSIWKVEEFVCNFFDFSELEDMKRRVFEEKAHQDYDENCENDESFENHSIAQVAENNVHEHSMTQNHENNSIQDAPLVSVKSAGMASIQNAFEESETALHSQIQQQNEFEKVSLKVALDNELRRMKFSPKHSPSNISKAAEYLKPILLERLESKVKGSDPLFQRLCQGYDKESLVTIALIHFLDPSSENKPLAQMIDEIGSAVERERIMGIEKIEKQQKPFEVNKAIELYHKNKASSNNVLDQPWDSELRFEVGNLLVEVLIENCFVPSGLFSERKSERKEEKVENQNENQNEFQNENENENQLQNQNELQFQNRNFQHLTHEDLQNLAPDMEQLPPTHIQEQIKLFSTFQAENFEICIKRNDVLKIVQFQPISSFLPMICPPRPWTGLRCGGYLNIKFDITRTMRRFPSALELLKKADDNGDLNDIYKVLNYLGGTEWKINEKTFPVIKALYNSQRGVAGLPPNKVPPLGPNPTANQRKAHADLTGKIFSMRCETNYKIIVAEKLIGKSIYFPHNMDFRGRVYPIPHTLNHMGNDLCRGLLLFGQGRPLGERGFYWLKVHAANMFGIDKVPLAERVEFIDGKMEQISSVVLDPITNTWWHEADYPFQFLATCIEIVQASRDPVNYVCHLPVQQDGSCNGLQHYAALGRDSVGASQVNLRPGNRPDDIYSAVAAKVKFILSKSEKPIAQELSKIVTRKIVKQPVMTNVYGVTFYGAKMQVKERLLEVGYSGDVVAASSLISDAIFKALSDLCTAAQKIQKWLVTSAREISNSVHKDKLSKSSWKIIDGPMPLGNTMFPSRKSVLEQVQMYPQTPVVWTTPLGLPVTQPYCNYKILRFHTLNHLISFSSSELVCINARKQINGIAPNYVHSLDSCHMFLTALECQKWNLIFASVHDSYWTLPCDVDRMRGILRQQFVHMHSLDCVERLYNQFVSRYKDHYVPVSVNGVCYWKKIELSRPPEKGDFVLDNVLESEYFFS